MDGTAVSKAMMNEAVNMDASEALLLDHPLFGLYFALQSL